MSAELSPLLLSMVERVGWGIVHSCWLGALCAILLGLIVRLMRSAAARHLACMLALVATLGSTVVLTARSMPSTQRGPGAAKEAFVSSAGLASLTVAPAETDRRRSAPAPGGKRGDGSARRRPPFDRSSCGRRGYIIASFRPDDRVFQAPHLIAPVLPWLTMSWWMGVVFLSLRHFAGWRRVRAWRRSGKRVVHAACSGSLRRSGASCACDWSCRSWNRRKCSLR